jgi:hypothetical protein
MILVNFLNNNPNKFHKCAVRWRFFICQQNDIYSALNFPFQCGKINKNRNRNRNIESRNRTFGVEAK